MKKLLILTYFLSCLSSLLFAQDRISGKLFATRSVVMARHGMA